MAEITYITIKKFCEFHEVEYRWLQEIIEHGLFTPFHQDGQAYIPEEDLSRLETMLRLRVQLDINPAGIETIMHMRSTIQQLQIRLRELEAQLK